MFDARFSMFVAIPNIEKREPNIKKGVSSLFRQGESPNGFSYWYNKAKAETHSLGFSDLLIFSIQSHKRYQIIKLT